MMAFDATPDSDDSTPRSIVRATATDPNDEPLYPDRGIGIKRFLDPFSEKIYLRETTTSAT